MLGGDQNLRVNLIGDSTQLNAALTKASSKLKNFSAGVGRIGQSLTTRLTLPLGIAAAAAIKTGMDFDKSMTKITTLVGISTDTVDSMRGAVKQLATDTGVSANSTADALFFITSAGLRGQDALDVLAASAKASAIGLGEVKTVADAVTSAVNAYGIENLSAEQATDVLTAAVREGKLEADSLAQSMGKVLPISSQLGVRFDEVGAALAAMSRTGTDAAMASTSLRGILSALLNPSSQAKEQLSEFGLSAQGLRDQLEEQGLLSVLETLTSTFGDNQEAAGKVFGNVRALTGVLDLMGKNVDSTRVIFDNMTDTTGTLNDGFSKLEGSMSFKFTKALQSVKTSFGELGETLGTAILPFIQKLTTGLTTIINKFNNMDSNSQNLILTIGALVTALGPLLLVLSGVATTIAVITSPVALVVAAIALIALGIDHAISRIDLIKLKFEQFGANAKIIAKAIGDSILAIFNPKKQKEISKNMAIALRDLNEGFDEEISKLDIDKSLIDKIVDTVSNVKQHFQAAGTSLGEAVVDGTEKALQTTGVVLQNVAIEAGAVTSEQLSANLRPLYEETQTFGQQILPQVGQALTDSFAAIAQGENPLQRLITTIKALVVRLLAAAAAAAVLSFFLGGPGGAMGTFKGFSGLFKGFSGGIELASGGIVTGPTNALIGEYPGARSNPEVVAPLNKLQSLLDKRNGNMQGQFILRGQDLVLALQKANKNRNRFM